MKTAICFLIVTLSMTGVVSGQDPVPSVDAKEVKEIKQIMDLREWSDSTGSFSTMARFKGVDFVGLTAILKLKNGETRNVPLAKLGEPELKTIARFYELNQIVVQKLKNEIEVINRQPSSGPDSLKKTMSGRDDELGADNEQLTKAQFKFAPIDQEMANQDNNAEGLPTSELVLLALGDPRKWQGNVVRFEGLGFIGFNLDPGKAFSPQLAGRYVGITACDVNDNLTAKRSYGFILAEKSQWSDLLPLLKKGDRINIEAMIQPHSDGNSWATVMDIQIVSEHVSNKDADPTAKENDKKTKQAAEPVFEIISDSGKKIVFGNDNLSYEIDSETPYSGNVIESYPNGQKKSEGTLLDGKQVGPWTHWHRTNGQKSMEGSCKNGKQEGIWTEWHDNGQKKSEGTYKDGKQVGPWTHWHRTNGQKKSEGNWNDGKMEGLWTRWDKDGKKEEEGTFKDGKPEGIFTEWDKDGKKIKEETWKDGKLIKEEMFDQQ